MKIEFEFDTDMDVVPAEGVAALFCFVPGEDEPLVLYGNMGDPNALTAVGLYSVALDDAKALFASGTEYED